MNVKMTDKIRAADKTLGRKVRGHNASAEEDALFERICEVVNYLADRADRKRKSKKL